MTLKGQILNSYNPKTDRYSISKELKEDIYEFTKDFPSEITKAIRIKSIINPEEYPKRCKKCNKIMNKQLYCCKRCFNTCEHKNKYVIKNRTEASILKDKLANKVKSVYVNTPLSKIRLISNKELEELAKLTELPLCTHCNKPNEKIRCSTCSNKCAQLLVGEKKGQAISNKLKDIFSLEGVELKHFEPEEIDKAIAENSNRNGLTGTFRKNNKEMIVYINSLSEEHVKLNVPKEIIWELYKIDKLTTKCTCGNTIIQKQNPRYGLQEFCSNSCVSINTRDRVKQTCINRYGTESYFKTDSFKDDYKKTCLEKYGFEHYAQSGLKDHGYKWKDYITPSGTLLRVQGHENFLLDELFKEYGEDEILTSNADMPVIMYEHEGKTKRYFPDVYIPSTNTIYEVKSEYTLQLEYDKNMLKFQAVKDNGFNFELKVY